jgi:ADP-heptose:LPS heptosyltransferase
VILYPRGNYIAMIPFYLRLRRNKYDLAIVPSTVSVSVTSALIALVSGAPVRCGAGSINGEETLTSPCFSVPVRLDWRSDPHRHQTLRNLDVAEPLNLGQTDLTTVIGLTEWERASATATLAELRGRHRFLLGVHPGAGKLENRWDTGKYISVINRLAENYPLGVVISVGPQDSDLRERILSSLRCDFIVLDHRPLRELAAAIDQLDCFLSNDTGIMHIAGAVRTHLLALFGPSDYLQWMPQGSNNRFLRGQDGTMTSIGEEEVYRELSAMLAQISTPG